MGRRDGRKVDRVAEGEGDIGQLAGGDGDGDGDGEGSRAVSGDFADFETAKTQKF